MRWVINNNNNTFSMLLLYGRMVIYINKMSHDICVNIQMYLTEY